MFYPSAAFKKCQLCLMFIRKDLFRSIWLQVNFQKNRIDCDCAPARTAVFKLPTLFPGLSPMANRTAYEYIIEHNYCAQQNVSLGEYGRQFLGGAVCSDRALNDAPTELNEITDEPIPQKNLLAAGAAVSHSLCLWFIVAVPLLRLTWSAAWPFLWKIWNKSNVSG